MREDEKDYIKWVHKTRKAAQEQHHELLKLQELRVAAVADVNKQYDELFDYVINGGKL